ncbi:MAG: hypothetical protein VKP70_00770 [Cyanobacteriota bacterium]|nr:hypothetical protein [Cyanobacteriota bacterium]
MSRARSIVTSLALVTGALAHQLAGPARGADIGSVVQAYCLVAFEQEMAQSGKVAPAGMADYACRCVVDRLTQGTSIDSARTACRASTARRFSL